ncbi:DUF4124 domain-containing protein [Curvibacter sp. HBC61]|uniref:DUF4124 domain-containing protein n=1 Tax=Curvibacter cyanobacteriorum TaxID=3026422 RepID=A0ABT5N5N1_9BURK|nr:DUF4124 domain-containing protein [Curvibacter sp. HBC61]MDD0840397.1 DUF4124 domain-containing protein [Curvibacter sp. HBC61]
MTKWGGARVGLVCWLGVGLHAGLAAQGIFTCVDASGRRITSDRPIPECLDREQRELNPSGTVKRKLAPAPTAQERAAAEERQRLQDEEQARLNEDRRRERALAARYPSQAAHDGERVEALKQVDAVVKIAQKRIDDLREQRKSILAEFEFYRKDPSKAPPALRQKLQDNQQAEEAQNRFIADQAREKDRINQRFDQELKRLQQIWGPGTR